MEAMERFAIISFVIVLGVAVLVMYVKYLTPQLQSYQAAMDETIALYVDTLSAVDEGSVRISNANGAAKEVEIAMLGKDDESGLGVKSDGWHVIVTYKVGIKETGSASRINTYPAGGSFQKKMVSPSSICIEKRADSIHPEVVEC